MKKEEKERCLQGFKEFKNNKIKKRRIDCFQIKEKVKWTLKGRKRQRKTMR